MRIGVIELSCCALIRALLIHVAISPASSFVCGHGAMHTPSSQHHPVIQEGCQQESYFFREGRLPAAPAQRSS
eukprot:1684317-Karenia_brevis.AAC.1